MRRASSLKAGKEEADSRVEQSLYQRAVGYSFESEKVFCNKDGEVTRVPIVEHVPPDVTACIFWLKNRDPAHWRDAWQLEATLVSRNRKADEVVVKLTLGGHWHEGRPWR
jgi:hypothetical protein